MGIPINSCCSFWNFLSVLTREAIFTVLTKCCKFFRITSFLITCDHFLKPWLVSQIVSQSAVQCVQWTRIPICLVLGCQNKLCTPVVLSGVRSVLSIVFEVRSEGPFFYFSSGHAKQDGGQRTLILNVRLQCCFW